jgi:hypothetical protein
VRSGRGTAIFFFHERETNGADGPRLPPGRYAGSRSASGLRVLVQRPHPRYSGDVRGVTRTGEPSSQIINRPASLLWKWLSSDTAGDPVGLERSTLSGPADCYFPPSSRAGAAQLPKLTVSSGSGCGLVDEEQVILWRPGSPCGKRLSETRGPSCLAAGSPGSVSPCPTGFFNSPMAFRGDRRPGSVRVLFPIPA